jgi:hypothetical protein
VLSPVYCQMIVTTGMLISGKISVGIDSTAVPHAAAAKQIERYP